MDFHLQIFRLIAGKHMKWKNRPITAFLRNKVPAWNQYKLKMKVATNIFRAWIKTIGKESSYVHICFLFWQHFYLWVFMLHRRIKKGKMMQSYVMIAYHQSSLKKHWNKNQFFFLKNTTVFWKKSQRLKWKNFCILVK